MDSDAASAVPSRQTPAGAQTIVHEDSEEEEKEKTVKAPTKQSVQAMVYKDDDQLQQQVIEKKKTR